MDEDVRILQHALHPLRVGDEVGRKVPAIEPHAFHRGQLSDHGLRLFDRDYAVFADFLHGISNDFADGQIAVGGNHADLRDHIARDRLGELLDLLDGQFDGFVDAALERHRVHTRCYGFDALAENRLRQNGGGSGAVAGYVGGL